MNEIQEKVIDKCKEIQKRLADLKNIQDIDELRLILILHRLEEAEKIFKDIGTKWFKKGE